MPQAGGIRKVSKDHIGHKSTPNTYVGAYIHTHIHSTATDYLNKTKKEGFVLTPAFGGFSPSWWRERGRAACEDQERQHVCFKRFPLPLLFH